MSIEYPNKALLGKHTRREFRERMQSGELKACIIPVAATEQHLEHPVSYTHLTLPDE